MSTSRAAAPRFPWLAPLATALTALALDLLPVPLTGGGGASPLFTLCLVCAWALQAPGAFPAPAAFALGLALDALAGTPLGFNSLVLLLARAATLAARRFLLGQPFVTVWAAFAAAAFAGAAARWLLAAAWWGHPFPLQPALAEAVLTFAAYPLAGWPVARLRPASRLGGSGVVGGSARAAGG